MRRIGYEEAMLLVMLGWATLALRWVDMLFGWLPPQGAFVASAVTTAVIVWHVFLPAWHGWQEERDYRRCGRWLEREDDEE